MMSPAEADKIVAQLDAIAAEIKAMAETNVARLKVLSADLGRIREKLL